MFLAIFSKNDDRIVLIFCRVVETNGLYDLAQAVFAYKNLARLEHARENVAKCPKMRFLANFSETGHRIFLKYCMLIEHKIVKLGQAAIC